MERSRLTYETTNQQLMGLINKLSSQLSRARISQTHPSKQIKEVKPASSSSNSTTGSSFRRQKAIRIKKRDSVKRNDSIASQIKAGDSQSYMSSDSGNFSDNDNKDNKDNTGENNTHLQKLLRKGLHLVNNVNQELNKEKLKNRDEIKGQEQRKDNCKDTLSSKISNAGNSNKVIIKIENCHQTCDQSSISSSSGSRINCSEPKTISGQQRAPMVHGGKSVGEILTDCVSGTVRVPVPYICTVYDV